MFFHFAALFSMRSSIFLVFVLISFFTFSPSVLAHPLDEGIILDIEQGELRIDPDKQLTERELAQRRRDMRRLNAMPWQEKFGRYFVVGVEHIVPKGLDHILFVVGIFLASFHFRRLVIQVSAFTLAHSLTLAAAMLGWVSVPASIVEPLIALSIAYMAFEHFFLKGAAKWRPIVVFLFGLLHGLGFASVLSAIGLPSESVLLALLAFNLGVEAGQLLVILACFILFIWALRREEYRHYVQTPGFALIGLVGTFWFFERVFF